MIIAENIAYTPPKTDRPILQDIDLEIVPKAISVFLGESGSGKTTLLKCLVKLINTYTGLIRYAKQSRVGYVSQHYQLFPHMTTLYNCVHPQRKILKRSLKEAEQRAYEFFAKLDLIDLINRYPPELSGGQQQRVAIARTLCMDFQTLVLDEPTSALDPTSTQQVSDMLLNLKSCGYTILISTHDMPFAHSVMDYAYLMNQGKIIEHFPSGQIPAQSKLHQFLFR